ncbi:MAG: DUF4388 domain-containing protein, partial [Thermoanaerobaculia bacterium]
GVIKILYFKGGDILSASTNDRSDSVDELLLRAGKVTREHVKQALAKRKENETLGDALLNLGFITRKELTWGRRVQVISVIRSVRSWKTGTYTIVADYLPKREEGTLFPLEQILVELIVTEQDRSEFERALDGGSAVFQKAANFDTHYHDLGLNEDADAVAAQIDGERAASEVASFAGRDAFNVFKLLHAFSVLGLIERKGKPQPSPEFSSQHAGDDLLSSAGVADADDVWNPTAPGTAPVPPPAAQAEPDLSEFGDAPTLEIPVMSLPPEPPRPQPRSVEIPEAPKRRPATQPGTRGSRPVLTSPGTKQKAGGSRRLIGIIVVLLLVGVGAFGAWQWWKKKTAGQPIVTHARPVATKKAAPRVTFVPPPSVSTMTTVTPATSSAHGAEVAKPDQNVTTSPQTTTRQPAIVTSKPAPIAPKPAPETTKPVAAKPEAPPSVPATRTATTGDKYADMAREYERTANGTYTVQFELVCQTASLAKAVDAGGSKVWFVPISYRGQSCYRVFWGRFNSRESAALAVSGIPRDLRGPAPAVVRVP